MATLTKYATSSSGGWANMTNAYVSNGAYATATPAKNGSLVATYGNFGFDEIPEGATITNVLIEAYWKVSTTGSVDTMTFASSGGEISFSTTTLTTAMKLDSASTTSITSKGNLIDGVFSVSVTSRRGNTNTAFTGSLDYVRVTVTYDSPPPTITIVDYSTDKISSVVGKNECSVTFSSNQDLSQWEVRADGSGVGSGDLIANGTTVVAEQPFVVYYNQLTWGDRTYRINVYGKNTGGVWSTYG